MQQFEEFYDADEGKDADIDSLRYDPSIEKLDEQELYKPRFFIREITVDPETGKKSYFYRPDGTKYWEMRDKGEWEGVPRIFEDDCEPFF